MSYDADTTSCGTVTLMPRITDHRLLGQLHALADEHGARRVYDAAAQIMNDVGPTAHPGWAELHDDPANGLPTDDEYGITKGLTPNAGELISDVLKLDRQYTDDELRNSPYAGTFADVVAASQDPAPVHTTGTPLIDLDEMHAQRAT